MLFSEYKALSGEYTKLSVIALSLCQIFKKTPALAKLIIMLNLILVHSKYTKLNVNGDGLMTLKYLFTNRCNISSL